MKNIIFKYEGILCVLLSAILFSIGGLLIKMSTWSAISINGMRSLFAAAVMFLIMRKSGHKIIWNKYVFAGAVVTMIVNTTFVIATKMTSAGNAIVLQFTQPIFIILFTWLFYKKRPSKEAAITCVVVFLGIVCFFFDSITFSGMIGNMFALTSGISYALVFMMKSIKKLDFESSVMFSFVLGFIVSLPFFAQETSYSYENWILVMLLGVFQMGIPFLILGRGLKLVSPITASLTSTIEPILNPVLVAVFYHEMLGSLAILGGVIVICASTIYNVRIASRDKG
ncbi:MAG: DMT family transporter [Lachnospiraceae bacterium]